MNLMEEKQKLLERQQAFKEKQLNLRIRTAAQREAKQTQKYEAENLAVRQDIKAQNIQRVQKPIQTVATVVSKVQSVGETFATGGVNLKQVGSAFLQVAKGSRKALLAGPDNIITKDPTMRARYIPQFKGSVNLKTIHDVRVSNAPQMLNLEKLRNLSRPVKRW